MPEPRPPKKTVRTFTITNLRNLFLFHMFVGMGVIFFLHIIQVTILRYQSIHLWQ